MNFVWIGFHVEGVPALTALLDAGAPIRAVLTLTPAAAAKRSGPADYFDTCVRYGVPMHGISDVNGPESKRILAEIAPDIAFVIGWHQIIRPETLRLATTGMIGAHASLLPRNRGSAPINWAIIKGEDVTGNSLIWLAEDVDAGDVIDQTPFPITPYDTCASLYARVAQSNTDMLLRALPRLLAGERPGQRQVAVSEPVLPRRRPADGLIDWTAPCRNIYDFVRALTRPYPGAFSTLGGAQYKVWQSALFPCPAAGDTEPGVVLGPIHSPVAEACGQAVACGDGALLMLELERDDGLVLRGRELAEQSWTNLRWGA